MRRIWWLGLGLVGLSLGMDGPTPPPAGRVESISSGDGGTIAGRLVGDSAAGFRFEPTPGQRGNPASLPLSSAGQISFDGPVVGPVGFPPIRVELGYAGRISGRLGQADDGLIRLEDGPGGAKVEIVRAGASSLSQRPGEAVVVRDGWESLDPNRWAFTGEPLLVESQRLEGSRALQLPANGAAITHTLTTPIASGRLEVAFHDPGGIVAGQLWFVDLMFRGSEGAESVRAVLNAAEETLGVQSIGGSALPVQLLTRKPGWHRLVIRFGPETELAVDGNELAHGRGPGGPLVEVRLAHQAIAVGADVPAEPAMSIGFDDFRLVRLAEPVGGLEVAPQLDDVRLIDGDQIFGRFRSADADTIRLGVDGRDIPLAWTEAASVQFRREPRQGRLVDGTLVQVEWRPGLDSRDLDAIDGALLAASETSLTVATAYAGDLTIPRSRVKRLKAVGRGTRVVIDPHAHHLGNDISVIPPLLDPPYPEGGTLERTLTLDKIPDPVTNPASLVLDIVQVIGAETGDPQLAALVRKGELRTNVLVNGQMVDFLNKHITTRNELPERIRLSLPAGLLHPGVNAIRIEQIGQQTDPKELDDLGILQLAIEFNPIKR